MSQTIVNPLNLYGPFIPPTFEINNADEEKVNELIDKKIENAAFIETSDDNGNNG